MALSNPNNLYSGGAVIFDSRPFTNFYLQSMARKRAREDAVDNYYRDLGKSLTPTGMAANDVNDFVSKKNQWQQDAIQNRRVLSNPKDPAYAEAISRNNYLYNDALEHAETSKSKVKDLFQGRTLIKPDHPFTESSVAALHDAGLPITQGYKNLDFSSLAYDEKPFEIADQQKYYKNALTGINLGSFVDKIDVNAKTHGKTVTTSFKYEPQALESLYDRAYTDLRSSQTLQKFVHNNLNNEFTYNALNPTFKEAFKRDIQSDEDFLAASLLTHAKTEYTKEIEQGFNQFQGMSLWAQNQKIDPSEVYAQSIVQAGNIAASTGDVSQLRNVASQLFTGNGQRRLGNKEKDVTYKVTNGRPSVNITTYPLTDSEREKDYIIKAQAVKDGNMKPDALNIEGLTSTFYLDEAMPQLISKLKGQYQSVIGGDVGAEKKINYTPPSNVIPKAPKIKSSGIKWKQ